MALPARQDSFDTPDADTAPPERHALASRNKSERALPPSLPLMLNARDLMPNSPTLTPTPQDPNELRLVALPEKPAPVLRKEPSARGGAVLRGIKDLQQLQKQTIAVLEAVKGTLDDIAQVLRSPEATRGMEKQQNAATLLAKGFAREAIEQAQGAATLLPANPETHLLLSLSLAADQQYEHSLAAARKGIALFDRRTHPLAIEAGLLHALASLGCGAEAVDRWTQIIDSLPLPILFDHLARIASCFPSEVTGGGAETLDELVNRRLARDDQNPAPVQRDAAHFRRAGTVHIRPDEIAAMSLFAGLDAAKDFKLTNTHRAILGLVARRLQLANIGTRAAGAVSAEGDIDTGKGGGVIRFLTECVIPLGNRGLERTADSLGRAAVRKLHRLHADAMTLHRALLKLEMAGAPTATRELRSVLRTWRKKGNKVVSAKRALGLSLGLMLAGLGVLAYVLGPMGALAGKMPMVNILGWHFAAVYVGPAIAGLGALLSFGTFLRRTWEVPMPENRAPLTRAELAYLNSSGVKHSLK